MEWLLLLLLGSLTAGTVYWTVSGRPAPPAGPEPKGEGPRSSPELPERPEKAPVIQVRARDVEKLREMLGRVSEPVQPEVVEAGKQDAKAAAEELRQKLRRRKKPLKVSFTTDQIIPRSSPHAHHRRPLQNAEQFVAQQLAEEALNLYERVERRVPGEEIKARIRSNIDDIRRWMEGLDGEEEEPVTFPEIIIPLTSQAMALEDLSEGLRKISESLAKDIASALRGAGPVDFRGEMSIGPPRPGQPPGPPPQKAPVSSAEFSGTVGLGAMPATIGAAPPPAQERPPSPLPSEGRAPPTEPGADRAASAAERAASAAERAATVAERAVTAAERAVSYVQAPAAAPPATPVTGAPGRQRVLYVVPQKTQIPGEPVRGIPDISVLGSVLPTGPGVPTGPSDYFRHAGEEFQFDEAGRLLTEGWSDEDFKREWERYKELPLVDRRAAGERRRPDEGGEEDRPDRRMGEDRRLRDLFQEREDFLGKWKRHEERKRLLDQRGIGAVPEADIIVVPMEAGEAPAFPFPGTGIPPEPIGLPEADQHPLDQALEEARTLVDQIHPEAQAGGGLPVPEELPPLTLPEAKTEFAERYEPREEGPPASRIEIVEPPLEPVRLPEPEPYVQPQLEREEEEAHEEAPEKRAAPEEKAAPPEPEAVAEELGEGVEAAEMPEMPEIPEERGPVQEIRGVLELKPPDEDDAPFLTLTYDFGKIPDSFKLSRDYHTMEFAYYKYKPMLTKAQEFARRKMLKSALNYYRVIKSQNIPPEFRRMINRNIQDITDYLEKFMMSRSGD